MSQVTPTLVSRDQFVELVREHGDPGPVELRETMAAEITIEPGRKLRFRVSTGDRTHTNDVIKQEGWRLDWFRRNPVVLWAHDNRSLPIAKASEIVVDDGVLRAVAEFATFDLNPLADRVFRLLKEGFLSAVSVGFVPLKWQWAEAEERAGGIDFAEQELVEFSVVPVPNNPNALVEFSRRRDCEVLREWARDVLGMAASDVVVPADEFEILRAARHAGIAEAALLPPCPPPLPPALRLSEAFADLTALRRRIESRRGAAHPQENEHGS